MRPPFPFLLSALILLTTSGRGAAPKEIGKLPKQEYVSFKLITDRNIFNANRSARSGRAGSGETRRPARVSTISLVGIMVYDDGEKGPFAFFDGSSSEFKKVLGQGKSIAGYQVAEITGKGVKLDKEGSSIDLQVGTQLRREEDGEWQVVGNVASSATTTTSSSSSESSDEEPDIVKRLMQKREQELK